MNPDTGTFHPLEEAKPDTSKLKKLEKSIAEQIESREKVDKKYSHIHPTHRALVVKASGKRVPAHWPIFELGEEIELGEFIFLLVEVNMRDLVIIPKLSKHSNFAEDLVGSNVEIKGHKFRARKYDYGRLTLRPVIGRPHNYMVRNG